MLQAAGHSVGLAGAEGVRLNGRTVRTGPLMAGGAVSSHPAARAITLSVSALSGKAVRTASANRLPEPQFDVGLPPSEVAGSRS